MIDVKTRYVETLSTLNYYMNETRCKYSIVRVSMSSAAKVQHIYM